MPTRIELWPEGVPGLRADAAPEITEGEIVTAVHHPSLEYFPADPARPSGTAVVVCPGGGYRLLSVVKEGHETAAWLNSLGVSAFVLRYRLGEYGHPAPLRDVLRALRLVRSRAHEFHLRPDRLGVLGFSAGGHLAACAATLHDEPEGRTGAALDATSARPDFALLIYPVISLSAPFTEPGSRHHLLGPQPDPGLARQLSIETRVTPRTPPLFIMHAADDTVVAPENAFAITRAALAAGVPAELHLYETGGHGFGARGDFEAARDWPRAATAWLRAHGWLTP